MLKNVEIISELNKLKNEFYLFYDRLYMICKDKYCNKKANFNIISETNPNSSQNASNKIISKNVLDKITNLNASQNASSRISQNISSGIISQNISGGNASDQNISNGNKIENNWYRHFHDYIKFTINSVDLLIIKLSIMFYKKDF